MGHCAQFGSYCLMDLKTRKILNIEAISVSCCILSVVLFAFHEFDKQVTKSTKYKRVSESWNSIKLESNGTRRTTPRIARTNGRWRQHHSFGYRPSSKHYKVYERRQGVQHDWPLFRLLACCQMYVLVIDLIICVCWLSTNLLSSFCWGVFCKQMKKITE